MLCSSTTATRCASAHQLPAVDSSGTCPRRCLSRSTAASAPVSQPCMASRVASATAPPFPAKPQPPDTSDVSPNVSPDVSPDISPAKPQPPDTSPTLTASPLEGSPFLRTAPTAHLARDTRHARIRLSAFHSFIHPPLIFSFFTGFHARHVRQAPQWRLSRLCAAHPPSATRGRAGTPPRLPATALGALRSGSCSYKRGQAVRPPREGGAAGAVWP
jgi:hypothetical protein